MDGMNGPGNGKTLGKREQILGRGSITEGRRSKASRDGGKNSAKEVKQEKRKYSGEEIKKEENRERCEQAGKRVDKQDRGGKARTEEVTRIQRKTKTSTGRKEDSGKEVGKQGRG